MAKVKLDLKSKTDAELLPFAKGHRDALVTHASTFATPNPTATIFDAAVAAYETALTELGTAQAAARAATARKDTTRAELEGHLTTRGSYVDDIAKGEAAIIEDAALGVRAAAAPIGALPAPGDLNATAGDQEGEVDLSWDRVRGAGSYVAEVREDTAGTSWTQATIVTKSRATVTGLVSGKKYIFRVRGIGAAGPGAWSDIAGRMAP
jgi:hypothetical protein